MAGGLALAACSSGGGGGGNGNGNGNGNGGPKELEGILFGDAEQSTGPAEEVPGAKTGGTVHWIDQTAPEHLDPPQIYVSHEMGHAKLIHRGLTFVRLNGAGDYTVIGDLATDSGVASDNARTWTYTLKDNIFFEDGSPITSADIRHSVERLFAPFVTHGPSYLQDWLAKGRVEDYRKLLEGGPYEGDHLPDDILETPDDKTVVFHFKDPQPDLPYCLSMAGYSAVSMAGDTKQQYDKQPLATGPYRIESRQSGRSMTLVRNEHWDPASDACRNAYPDRWEISYGHSLEDTTTRLMADRGDDQHAVTFANGLDSGNGPTVMEDPQYEDRLIDGYQSYVYMLAINMDRVTDKKVREAICHAVPLNGILNGYGGALGGEYAGGVISPLLPGYEDGYDPYGKLAKPEGDPDRARQLLQEADAVGYTINYYHRVGDDEGQVGPSVESALEAAGFKVNRTFGASETYYDEIGEVDNGLDLYRSAWGHDWPSSSTVIPPLFDGREIADGAANYSHTNDQHVMDEIDRILKIGDPDQQATEWFNLNKHIMEEILPVVPAFYYRQLMLHGSKVGGVVFNNDMSSIDINKVFLTDA